MRRIPPFFFAPLRGAKGEDGGNGEDGRTESQGGKPRKAKPNHIHPLNWGFCLAYSAKKKKRAAG